MQQLSIFINYLWKAAGDRLSSGAVLTITGKMWEVEGTKRREEELSSHLHWQDISCYKRAVLTTVQCLLSPKSELLWLLEREQLTKLCLWTEHEHSWWDCSKPGRSAASLPALSASRADHQDWDAGFGAFTVKYSKITVYTHRLAPVGVEWDPIPQLCWGFSPVSCRNSCNNPRLYAFQVSVKKAMERPNETPAEVKQKISSKVPA